MIGVETKITVIPSDELAGMHLSDMIGRKGRVVELIYSSLDHLIGYAVCLDKSFQGECLWFVPQNAVSDEEDTE